MKFSLTFSITSRSLMNYTLLICVSYLYKNEIQFLLRVNDNLSHLEISILVCSIHNILKYGLDFLKFDEVCILLRIWHLYHDEAVLIELIVKQRDVILDERGRRGPRLSYARLEQITRHFIMHHGGLISKPSGIN